MESVGYKSCTDFLLILHQNRKTGNIALIFLMSLFSCRITPANVIAFKGINRFYFNYMHQKLNRNLELKKTKSNSDKEMSLRSTRMNP